MPEKTAIRAVILSGCLTVAAISLLAGFRGHAAPDRDTLGCLIQYGRGDLAAGPKIIWNVHIIYGLFIYCFSFLTSHLTAPVVFLSLISLILIALGGFFMLRQYIPGKKALWGFILILFLPGLHSLNLMIEDNLPYLAGIVWLAVCLGTLERNGFSWRSAFFGGVAMGMAFLFHTVAIVFALTPFLLLWNPESRRKAISSIALIYAGCAVCLLFFLSLIPGGISGFISAYIGAWGVDQQVISVLTHASDGMRILIKEINLLFRSMQAAALNLENIRSLPIKTGYLFLLILTNILYYGLIGTGLFRALRRKYLSPVHLGFLMISVILPFALFSFSAERLDTFAFFALALALIGHFKNRESLTSRTRAFVPALLFIFFLGWTGVLYAYMTRWLYKPPYYQKIIHLLETTAVNGDFGNGMLFLDEESLFRNNDYCLLIRQYPRMRHYGIEKNGNIYFIGDPWGTVRNYLSADDIENKFYSGSFVNYATPAGESRFFIHHKPGAAFEPLPFTQQDKTP